MVSVPVREGVECHAGGQGCVSCGGLAGGGGVVVGHDGDVGGHGCGGVGLGGFLGRKGREGNREGDGVRLDHSWSGWRGLVCLNPGVVLLVYPGGLFIAFTGWSIALLLG